MYCPECGTKNEDDALFCGECGTSLKEYQEQVAAFDQEQDGAEMTGQVQNMEPADATGYDTVGYDACDDDNYYDDNYDKDDYDEYGHYDDTYDDAYDDPDDDDIYDDVDDAAYNDDTYAYDTYHDIYAGEPVPRKQKGKRSKGSVVVLVEALLGAVLLIVFILIMNNRYSAENVALSWWKAEQSCQWDRAYSYCSIPDSALLTRQMYVNAHSSDTTVLKYRSVSAKRQVGTSSGKDVLQYTIQYITEESSDTNTQTVKLVKDGKKFLFWNDWRVLPEDSWVKDYTFYVQDGAEILLDGKNVSEISGVKTTEDEDNAGWQSVVLPYLFNGSYQLEVKADGMNTWRDNLEVSSYDTDYLSVQLTGTEETKEKVATQFVEDLQTYLESAAAQKDFSEVEDLFSEDAVKNSGIKKSYQALQGMTTSNYPVLSYSLSNIKVTITESFGSEMYLDAEWDAQVVSKSSWSTQNNNYSGTVRQSCKYVFDGKEWKLGTVPVDSYDF